MNLFTIEIKKLAPDAPIPYNLLLLADETVESINKYLPQSEIYIASVAEEVQPIAVMAMQLLNKDEIEIKNIAVATHLQSRGIGKYLIEKAVEIARQHKCNSLKVGTGDCGFRQISFYERNGFKKCGAIKNFFIDNFPESIYENGIMLKDMVILERDVEPASCRNQML